MPMRLPYFDEAQIAQLAEKPFSQNMADILNLFFGTRLDGRSLEFGIGRYPIKLSPLCSKITVAECWHNPSQKFERLISGTEKALRQSDQINRIASDWLQIATRIAVLFGIVGQLLRSGSLVTGNKLDVSVPSGDLSALMAVWYARAMGLPVGTIICSCNENTMLWNLLHKGELRTDAIAVRTHTPDCDYAVPYGLERLVFAALDREETKRFCEICRVGGNYYLESKQRECLSEGIYVSVVSDKRMASTIPNLYKTTGFVADPYTALAYSGLIDYRAAIGECRQGLIMAEESPLFSLQFVAECMNVTPAELRQLLD